MIRTLLVLLSLASAAAFTSPAGLLRSQCAVTGQCRSMATMRAATKPMRVNERNRQYNKKYKSEMRTRIKTVEKAVEEGDYKLSFASLSKAMQVIDKNVKRGILHKNNAARKKSRLTLMTKELEPKSAAPAEAPAAAAEEA